MKSWPVSSVIALIAVTGATWIGLLLPDHRHPPQAPAEVGGTGFRAERSAQPFLFLSGWPYALGFFNSELFVDLTPSDRRPEIARAAPAFDERLSAAERLETLGLADGSGDTDDDRYWRWLARQARRYPGGAPSVTAPGPLLAVSSDRGIDGHAFLARNLDLPGNWARRPRSVVLVTRPQTGYGFISVDTPGKIGVVTGINEFGLAVAVQTDAEAEADPYNVPAPILAQRALETCRTVEQAVVVLTSTRTADTWTIALTDRLGRATVLRFAPGERSKHSGGLLVAAPAARAAAEAPPESRRLDPAVQRQLRLTRLVQDLDAEAGLGPLDLLKILRDRRAADGHDLPLGHPHALDSLSAVYSVLFDTTAGRLWISAGPFTLGRYMAYDVATLLAARHPADIEGAALPDRDLSADPLLAFAPQVHAARRAWLRARRALAEGDLLAAEDHLAQTTALADHPTSLYLRGLLAGARGDRRWALDFFYQALRGPAADSGQAEAIQADIGRR